MAGMDIDLLKKNRDEILRLALLHGAYNVRVFGSVVRGEAGAESDIDFLVEMEQGRSLFDRAAFMLALQELLGRRVDVATERGLKAVLRDQVLQEAVPL